MLEEYASIPETLVYGLSRRPAPNVGNVQHISADLLDAADLRAKLVPFPGITHLFFGAIDKQDPAEKSEAHFNLLTNQTLSKSCRRERRSLLQSVQKRQAGFQECIDSETMFTGILSTTSGYEDIAALLGRLPA